MKKLYKILGRLSVNAKITSIAVFMGLLALVFTVILARVSINSNNEYQESLRRFAWEFALIKDISENSGKIHATAIETLLFWGQHDVVEKLSHDFDVAFEKIERDIVELERLLPPDSRQNEAINKAYGYMYHLQSFRYSLPPLINNQKNWEDFFVQLQDRIAKPLSDNIAVAIESLVSGIATEADRNQDNFNKNIKKAYIAIGAIFLAGGLYILLILNDIRASLKDLMITSERFARRDFKGLTPTWRTDELGVLTNKFINAALHLEDLYDQLDLSGKNSREGDKSLEGLSSADPLTDPSEKPRP